MSCLSLNPSGEGCSSNNNVPGNNVPVGESLTELPNELLVRIMRFLDLNGLDICSQVDKSLNKVSKYVFKQKIKELLDLAKETAQRIQDPSWQSEAFFKIVKVLAQRDVDATKELAQGIQAPSH